MKVTPGCFEEIGAQLLREMYLLDGCSSGGAGLLFIIDLVVPNCSCPVAKYHHMYALLERTPVFILKTTC